MAKILLKLEGKVIREYEVKNDRIKVGRKPDNDIVINNPAISGYHCVIEKKGDTFTVEDLDSTNGTSVNDERVKKRGLHQNDIIGVAKHTLVFLEDASHAAVAAHSAPKVDEEPDAPEEKSEASEEKPQEPVPVADATQGPSKPSSGDDVKVGVLKILKGGDTSKTYEVKGSSLYIGKSDRAQIPIEGGGLFGSAPDVAASIHIRPEGFVLVAVEDGYPVVSGSKVNGKVQLKDGDIIECGATTLQFSLK